MSDLHLTGVYLLGQMSEVLANSRGVTLMPIKRHYRVFNGNSAIPELQKIKVKLSFKPTLEELLMMGQHGPFTFYYLGIRHYDHKKSPPSEVLLVEDCKRKVIIEKYGPIPRITIIDKRYLSATRNINSCCKPNNEAAIMNNRSISLAGFSSPNRRIGHLYRFMNDLIDERIC